MTDTLAGRLTAAREALGISQSEAARRAKEIDAENGPSRSAVQFHESGAHTPGLKALRVYAELYGLDLAELLESC